MRPVEHLKKKQVYHNHIWYLLPLFLVLLANFNLKVSRSPDSWEWTQDHYGENQDEDVSSDVTESGTNPPDTRLSGDQIVPERPLCVCGLNNIAWNNTVNIRWISRQLSFNCSTLEVKNNNFCINSNEPYGYYSARN